MPGRESIRADLERHFQIWQSRPFDYSQKDCARWAAAWACVDLVKDWNSEREALRVLSRRYDGRRLAEAVDRHLIRIKVSDARYGDLVALDTPPLDTLGICIGYTAVFLGPLGYVRRPRSAAFAAWHVER